LIVKISQGKNTVPEETMNIYKYALHKNM
jgi:hypothetical protein